MTTLRRKMLTKLQLRNYARRTPPKPVYITGVARRQYTTAVD